MVLFWLSMGVFRPKNGMEIGDMFPDPFFIKRVKRVQYIEIFQKIKNFSILGKFCRNFCRTGTPFYPFFKKKILDPKEMCLDFGPLCPQISSKST
jgi:hypothetical protein